ncbi:MAG: hypothetical protein ACOX6Q_03730 [Candidatus Dojkabacteria bacterium]|jgi:hypothetical protein
MLVTLFKEYMKEEVKKFFVNFLIIYLAIDTVGNSIHMPARVEYLLFTYFVIALAISFVNPLLRFLTVKSNFITYFLVSTLLLIGVLFMLKMFMIDFTVDSYDFDALTIGSLHIESFNVTPMITIVTTSLFVSCLAAIYKELDKSS